jgi:hypothetical protein
MALISRQTLQRSATLRALRWVLPWSWAVRGARGTYAAGEHVGRRLTPDERRRFLRLIWKSRGRRSNLTPREQLQVRRIARKVDPRDLVQAVAAEFSPLPWPKPPA